MKKSQNDIILELWYKHSFKSEDLLIVDSIRFIRAVKEYHKIVLNKRKAKENGKEK
jgi:hypothetical protein